MVEWNTPAWSLLVLRFGAGSANRRQVKISDFQVEASGAVNLSDSARKLILTTWQERKKEQIMHPFLQEKITIGYLPHVQARLLALHVRGALDAYPPMVWK